jgi:hypothetical protein
MTSHLHHSSERQKENSKFVPDPVLAWNYTPLAVVSRLLRVDECATYGFVPQKNEMKTNWHVKSNKLQYYAKQLNSKNFFIPAVHSHALVVISDTNISTVVYMLVQCYIISNTCTWYILCTILCTNSTWNHTNSKCHWARHLTVYQI